MIEESNKVLNVLFYKDNDSKWYADVPEWTGEKWELEMVCGADTMLEIVSQGEDKVRLTLSTAIFDGHNFTLDKIKDTPDIGGALYKMNEYNGIPFDIEVWLCHVTGFVFGHLPEIIYISHD